MQLGTVHDDIQSAWSCQKQSNRRISLVAAEGGRGGNDSFSILSVKYYILMIQTC